jgi:hypothetical protein
MSKLLHGKINSVRNNALSNGKRFMYSDRIGGHFNLYYTTILLSSCENRDWRWCSPPPVASSYTCAKGICAILNTGIHNIYVLNAMRLEWLRMRQALEKRSQFRCPMPLLDLRKACLLSLLDRQNQAK